MLNLHAINRIVHVPVFIALLTSFFVLHLRKNIIKTIITTVETYKTESMQDRSVAVIGNYV